MKKIIIMGATSGIGLQVAERLAQKGYMVGAAGRKHEVLKKLKKAYPDNIETEVIDITENDAPKKLGSLIKKLGGMDTYFHVAGVGFENAALNAKDDLQTVKTNVEGFVRMIDTAFHFFKKRGHGGHIAAVTSVAGVRGIGALAAYSASKSFNQTYLEALDQLSHNQGLGIRFTDVRPGWIRTPLLNPTQNYPMTMSLDYASPRIIKSLGRQWRINYVDYRWGLAAMLMKIVPPCLWRRINIPVYSLATHAQAVENAKETVAAEKVTKVAEKDTKK